MTWSKVWYRVRKFFGQLTYDEEQAESCKRLRQSLEAANGVKLSPPFDTAADMKANPLKYGLPMNMSGNITKGPENIPGPHPKPAKKKRPVRSITDDWEVTQDTENQ